MTVDDDRRRAVFERLRDEVGLTPDAILNCPASKIAAVIAGGGMRPPMRAEKLLECARIASAQDVDALRANALRVLLRLGFGHEEKRYSATSPLIRDSAEGRRGHHALRKHGQVVCKRSAPRCEICAVRTECNWYSAQT